MNLPDGVKYRPSEPLAVAGLGVEPYGIWVSCVKCGRRDALVGNRVALARITDHEAAEVFRYYGWSVMPTFCPDHQPRVTLQPADDGSTTIHVPAGFEIDMGGETGQPNGRGETEESSYREWFRDDRVTHDRHLVTITGPWIPRAREQPQRIFCATPAAEALHGVLENVDTENAVIQALAEAGYVIVLETP